MTSSTEPTEEVHIDYELAQQEIMMQTHDPIQESIEAIERQYQDDKTGTNTAVLSGSFVQYQDDRTGTNMAVLRVNSLLVAYSFTNQQTTTLSYFWIGFSLCKFSLPGDL